MKKKNEKEELREAIRLLKIKQAEELNLLKEQFHLTLESLKPLNLIKSIWHDTTSSSEIKRNLLNTAIGMTTGYISKTILIGLSRNPIKRILGTLLQFAISVVVSKHPDAIKSAGEKLVKRIFKNKEDSAVEFHQEEI